MEWEDNGLIIHTRPYSDSSLIVTLLTPAHGKRSGMLRLSRQKYGNPYQMGTLTRAHWHARLESHLGTLRLETLKALGVCFLSDPLRLKLLTCACIVVYDLLPEHDAHPQTYQDLMTFLEDLHQPEPLRVYALFELALLKELGYRLELGTCAVTGTSEDLVYVSPKTGRAVSRQEGKAYHDKLLTLPAFLRDTNASASQAELRDGLRLTAYFLEKCLYGPSGKKLPQQRGELA
jgi:DNA repair protein RecO (recombination protein O)